VNRTGLRSSNGSAPLRFYASSLFVWSRSRPVRIYDDVDRAVPVLLRMHVRETTADVPRDRLRAR